MDPSCIIVILIYMQFVMAITEFFSSESVDFDFVVSLTIGLKPLIFKVKVILSIMLSRCIECFQQYTTVLLKI